MNYLASFERFEIEITAEQARLGATPGQEATEAILYLLTVPSISKQLDAISAADIAAELEEYGAWIEEGELDDEQANRERILWIACGNVREEFKL